MSNEEFTLQAVYIISVAAELAGMHPQTLRMYEQKGLVNPARTQGGSRRYSELDIHQLHRIQELTNQGINLEGVKRIIELEAQMQDARDELQALRAQVNELVNDVHRSYRRDLVPVSKQTVAIFRPRAN